ncbi:MAG: CvpA family protein, partial [Candidatus Komeilibacteria bacterium]|nr:CvpA family protein [Candidatus Komeilibacteria bacterium]
MTWIDYALLVLLAYFIFKGARRGFVATIGAFIGIVLGAWAAGQYYDSVAQWLIEFWDFSIMFAIVFAFVGIYLAVNIAMSLVIRFATLVLRILPLGKTMNRLIGAVLGLAEGLLLIGLI